MYVGFKGFHNRARLGLACAYAYINGFKYANKTHIPYISGNCGYQLFSLCLCLRFFYVRKKQGLICSKKGPIFSRHKKHKPHTCTNTNVTIYVCVLVCVLFMFLFMFFYTRSKIRPYFAWFAQNKVLFFLRHKTQQHRFPNVYISKP